MRALYFLFFIFFLPMISFGMPGGGGGGGECPSNINNSPGNSGGAIDAIVYNASGEVHTTIVCDRTGGASPNIDCNIGDYDFPDGYFIMLEIGDNTCFYDTDGELIDDIPLPVELTLFKVKENNKGIVKVKWKTASEENNDYFAILRSNDGFEWEEIAQIKGAGNATTENSYMYKDKEPFLGISYYRLKQVDYDGEFNYSNIRSITITPSEIEQVKTYPNPVAKNENLHINFDYVPEHSYRVYIFNQQGVLLQQEILYNKYNDLKHHLSPGTYFIKIEDQDQLFYNGRLVVR